jgi:hypothetical protein
LALLALSALPETQERKVSQGQQDPRVLKVRQVQRVLTVLKANRERQARGEIKATLVMLDQQGLLESPELTVVTVLPDQTVQLDPKGPPDPKVSLVTPAHKAHRAFRARSDRLGRKARKAKQASKVPKGFKAM